MPPPPPKFVQRQIVGDGQEPGQNGADVRIKSSGMLPDAKHCFLKQVLGHLPITYDADKDGEHGAGMAIVELFERTGFTSSHALDQNSIADGLIHSLINQEGPLWSTLM